MSMTTILIAMISAYLGFIVGKYVVRTAVARLSLDHIISSTKIPIGIAEKIDGEYYVYEKDTTNFLCQAPTLEELPMKMFENNKISLAVLMCPEESAERLYWCVHGKLKTAK